MKINQEESENVSMFTPHFGRLNAEYGREKFLTFLCTYLYCNILRRAGENGLQVRGLARSLKTNPQSGVRGTEQDLARRMEEYGPNRYPKKAGKSFWVRSWKGRCLHL